MPRGDGTGPEGRGPMTGRGLGYCAGYSTPGFTKGVGRGLARGRGRGLGRGLGRGFRGGRGRAANPPRRFAPPVERVPVDYPRRVPVYQEPSRAPRTQSRSYSGDYSRENEIEDLKAYAEDLKRELDEVERRIDELSD